MSRTIDARGLTCPQPVILTKRAMDDGDQEITAIVDNTAAVENVGKLAKSQNYDLKIEERDELYYIHMARRGESPGCLAEDYRKVALLIKSNLFGQGAEELGQVLMKSLMFTLNELPEPVTNLFLMNSGVFLTTEGSPVLEHLQSLEQQGCEIMSCGTCLDYYGLKEKLAVGRVTNMYNIMETMLSAGRSLVL